MLATELTSDALDRLDKSPEELFKNQQITKRAENCASANLAYFGWQLAIQRHAHLANTLNKQHGWLNCGRKTANDIKEMLEGIGADLDIEPRNPLLLANTITLNPPEDIERIPSVFTKMWQLCGQTESALLKWNWDPKVIAATKMWLATLGLKLGMTAREALLGDALAKEPKLRPEKKTFSPSTRFSVQTIAALDLPLEQAIAPEYKPQGKARAATRNHLIRFGWQLAIQTISPVTQCIQLRNFGIGTTGKFRNGLHAIGANFDTPPANPLLVIRIAPDQIPEVIREQTLRLLPLSGGYFWQLCGMFRAELNKRGWKRTDIDTLDAWLHGLDLKLGMNAVEALCGLSANAPELNDAQIEALARNVASELSPSAATWCTSQGFGTRGLQVLAAYRIMSDSAIQVEIKTWLEKLNLHGVTISETEFQRINLLMF